MKNAKVIYFLLLTISFLLVCATVNKHQNTSAGANIKSTKTGIQKQETQNVTNLSSTTVNSPNVDNLLVVKINTKDIVNKINEKSIAVVNSTLKEYGIKPNNDILNDTANSEGIIFAHLYHFKLQYSSKNIDLIEMVFPATGLSYLVFEEDNSNITFMGNINLPGRNLNYEPEFRIEEDVNSKKAWIVFRELNGYGTGFIEFDNVWYGINNDSISEDLRYITENHDWGSPNQLVFTEVESTVSKIKQFYLFANSQDKCYIDVNYEIKFTDSSVFEYQNEDDAFLFSAFKRVRYIWDSKGKCFTIDKENLEGDEAIFDFSKESLLKNYSKEIDKLSKSKIKIKTDWLKKLNNAKPD